ncbi:MAG TPA: cation-translocating P-type ATPase [Phycisphaerae bacterium]|mgnify:CR=1 FL=1|nr:cation-translocating P-type ATPase [Phycisphaerae bacterium]HOJ75057.1 cation-translocating P-type ATPase [Phycisphaerae bacterium]HOM51928.1 cation-translocating P-type ATPase [Phycisphaerae bacterium]HOQ86134.1 cation-translocating P-type ATPase [Phycisphaerae bacterium]HPP28089.1 cation-translocating P-type ATPase [Phycisphaerae bacterium]
MAHDHLKQSIEAQTGRSSVLLIATLMGGLLVFNSFVAEYVFKEEEYSAAFALLGAVLLGAPLVVHALKHLLGGHLHMDELVAIAVLAAIAIGDYQEAGVIAFFMIISTLVETRTALGARASIQSLIKLTPTRAHVVEPDGREVEVEAASLRPGQIIRVRPGDNIAADGVVVAGESTVNQANITGESFPVDKSEGAEVFNGTVNLSGTMDIRVTKAGSETTLGRVQSLILQAERTRIPLMRLIDQYAAWYTPTILMLAGLVLFFKGGREGMERGISMLVVACPCALVLATPTAMVAALSCAARLGILVKNVVTLEAVRNLTAVMFDKTGTLTTGELSVTQMKPAPGVDPTDLLRAAASVEEFSRHPTAKALLAVARRARLRLQNVEKFEEVSGRGVSGVIDGQEILVGRRSWLAERGVDMSLLDQPEFREPDGISVLCVARGGRLIGWVGMEDRTREEARTAIDALRQLGVRTVIMVTGDKWSVAKRVAGEMGCTDVHAEVLPARKLEIVDELKARGHRVAVIGDGVNDAPALAAGDFGVAMGAAGSDVAIHSASIALMNNDLRRIPFLIKLSRATARVIWQNLLFGVAFIVVLLILGALGYLPAMMAAFLHMVASAVVIFNSARLVRFGEDLEAEEVRQAARPVRRVPPHAPAPAAAAVPA